jgi:hypothetical protein
MYVVLRKVCKEVVMASLRFPPTNPITCQEELRKLMKNRVKICFIVAETETAPSKYERESVTLCHPTQ